MTVDRLKNKIENARLCGEVRALDYADYASALDYFVREVTKWKTIESVYQFGSVSAPGLSDIDLLMVMKDNKRDMSRRYSVRNFPEDIQYIVAHDGFLMNKETLRNLPYWFAYFNLKHVYGSEVEIDETHKDSDVLKSIFLTNYLITKVPSDFLFHSCLQGYFHERIMENMVHSLCHSLTLWAQIQPTEQRREYSTFQEHYQVFRKTYVTLPKDTRIAQLRAYTVQAILLGYQLVNDMDQYLRTHWFQGMSLPRTLSFHTGTKRLVFQNSFSSEEALSHMLDSTDKRVLYYPISFGVFLHHYTSSQGIVGRHVAQCLHGNKGLTGALPVSVQTLFNQHVNTIEQYARFHSTKFRVPMQGYYTYWAPHSLSLFRRATDKAINRAWWAVYKEWKTK